MTGAGWIVMLLSVGAVTALFVWTLFRVLARRPAVEKSDEDSNEAGD